MKTNEKLFVTVLAVAGLALVTTGASAHKLRESGKNVVLGSSKVSVTPSRDWNRLSQNIGKNTETWTIDGEQLNDVTFFLGIEPGMPLVRERSKKKEPMPKFMSTTLLVEVPELLETTYRAYKGIGTFEVISVQPEKFLGAEGVNFSYKYVDADELTRLGEARAVIVKGKLYMFTYDAPRLNYYDKAMSEYQALVKTAVLSK